MNIAILTVVLLGLTVIAYYMGRMRAIQTAGGHTSALHSLPSYYGAYAALWCVIPALLVMFAWQITSPYVLTNMLVGELPAEAQALPSNELGLLLNDVRNLATGNIVSREVSAELQAAADYLVSIRNANFIAMAAICLGLAVGGTLYSRSKIGAEFRARNSVERTVRLILITASFIAILTTIGIVLSLLVESMLFFEKVSLLEFLFGLTWSPQTALRADQVGASGAFGAVPVFAGTLLITVIAMAVAVPIGLMSAIYMSEYATPHFRAWAKPLLEILAGIPTVVYGFFAALTVAPVIRGWGESLGLSVASESALAAGAVMGIMIIPFVSSLSDDVINAVPQTLRDGSYALGATKSETIRQVIVPAALPGIVGSVLLAVSRAIGETMIVVMAAGLSANLTANPFEAVTTVTVQIVTLLVGDQEFDSAKTLAAFALGLVLFFVTLCLNVIALTVVRKYREKYD